MIEPEINEIMACAKDCRRGRILRYPTPKNRFGWAGYRVVLSVGERCEDDSLWPALYLQKASAYMEDFVLRPEKWTAVEHNVIYGDTHPVKTGIWLAFNPRPGVAAALMSHGEWCREALKNPYFDIQ